jgi:hypothetical protein
MRKRKLMPLLGIVSSICCLACPPPPPISAGTVRLVSREVPPKFEFKGELILQYVQFVGPYSITEQRFLVPDSDDPDRAVAWRIYPPNFRFIRTYDCPIITFGQLPLGWNQVTPKIGSATPLMDGAVYRVSAELNQGRRIVMCILIQDGKAHEYHGIMNGVDCDKE